MRGVRRWPSLKEALISLNRDLQELDAACDVRDFSPLTRFEELVIALEDKRFLGHWGIDWKSVARVILKAIIGKSRGGASTIEMQFVRTVLDRRERTLSRKFREMLLAWFLCFRAHKIQVLRSYMARAFFGSHLIGSEYASKELFHLPTAELADEEAAFLAAMLVYPRPMNPTEAWWQRVERRAKYGLRISSNEKRPA